RHLRLRGSKYPWTRWRRSTAFFCLAQFPPPAFDGGPAELDADTPAPQSVGEIGQHPALDLRQHIPHQAVRARALAIAAVADDAEPEMRWFDPAGACLCPAGIAD